MNWAVKILVVINISNFSVINHCFRPGVSKQINSSTGLTIILAGLSQSFERGKVLDLIKSWKVNPPPGGGLKLIPWKKHLQNIRFRPE